MTHSCSYPGFLPLSVNGAFSVRCAHVVGQGLFAANSVIFSLESAPHMLLLLINLILDHVVL